MSRTDAYKLIFYDVTRKLERIHVMKIGFSNKSEIFRKKSDLSASM